MAFYVDEGDIWKCSKHPSKRRRTGICPTCLRDRLIELCPECANKRPCACDPHLTDSTSSSSSNSSSFHVFHFSRAGSLRDGQGETGRVSNLIENEPAFRKSRSLAIPFLRSRSRYVTSDRENDRENEKRAKQVSRSKIRFWSIFRSKKYDLHGEDDHESNKSDVLDYSRMMRSKSVAVSSSRGGPSDHGFSQVKHNKKWYFPSPLKAFRQSKRSPLHRG